MRGQRASWLCRPGWPDRGARRRVSITGRLVVLGDFVMKSFSVRTPTSTRYARAFSLPSKWEAQEIVIGENKQFARRSESLPTRFPCFRYTSAQQPTSLRRKLSPTLRWPIGGHRSFYSPNTRRLFVKQNVGPVPVTGPRLSFYHPQPEPGA